MGKITKNTFWLFGSQVFTKTVGFFYVVYLARALGVAEFGRYESVLAFIFIFFTLVDFGLNRLLIRDVSRKVKKAGLYLGNALGFRLTLSVIAYGMVLIFAFIFNYPPSVIWLVALSSLIFFFQGFWFCFEAVFMALEKMTVCAFGAVVLAVSSPFFGILLLKLGFGVAGILAGMVISSLAALFYFSFLAKARRISWRISFTKEFFCLFLKEGSRFAFLTIASLVYLKNGMVVLSKLAGEEAVGLYAAAYKIVEVGILFPNALAMAFFPQVSRLIISNKKRLAGLYFKSVLIAFLLALPLLLLANLFPKEILGFLFGMEFTRAASAFSVLGLSLVLFFVNALPGNIIQSSKRLTSFLPWAFFNTLFNIALNLFLIPRFSLLGAAYAILITEAVGFVINNIFVIGILRR